MFNTLKSFVEVAAGIAVELPAAELLDTLSPNLDEETRIEKTVDNILKKTDDIIDF